MRLWQHVRNPESFDMQFISSTSNEKIKRTALYSQKASARKEDGVFIAEGTKLVIESPGDLIREIFVSESCFDELKSGKGNLWEKFNELRSSLPEEAVIKVSDHVFEKISSQKSPQGMLAVVRTLSYKKEDITKGNPLILILEDIQDPGNVGTVFRTAEAAGVTGIILSEGCADPMSPKVVRSTMGAIFRMPFVITSDLPATVRTLEKDGIACYAARLDAASEYDKCDLTAPSALLIGNEGNGLSAEVTAAASKGIFIPMSGKTESLNAAVSASILSYEAARQRRNK